MHRIVVCALLSWMLIWRCGLAAEIPEAAPESVGMSSEKLAHVKPLMQTFVDDQKIAGAVVAVTCKGKLVLLDVVGKRSVDGDEPLDRDAIFRIYSMTKPITSVAVMMLAEQGKLDLDDPVAKHLPEFAAARVFSGDENGTLQIEDAERSPTIRDLLRHTSGLTYGFFGNTAIDQQYRAANLLGRDVPLSEMVTRLGKIPLAHQPGTRFQYSVSTDVLGRIVEVASEQSFDEYLQSRVFEPLEMRDTGFYVPEEKVPRFTANHSVIAGTGLGVIDAPQTSDFCKKPGQMSGGGGLVSTARDYVRFCQLLVNRGQLDGQRLLREESVLEMTRNQLPQAAYPISIGVPRPGVGFGLGFSVVVEETEFTSVARVGEYGWGGAASTHFWISPKDDLAVVVLTQLMPFNFQLEQAVKPVVYDALMAAEKAP